MPSAPASRREISEVNNAMAANGESNSNGAADGAPNKDVVIVGAGLVGALLAVILQNEGFQVTVYERYGNILDIPSLGRSINLSITKRGLKA